MKYSPPKLPLHFFRWFCHRDLRDTIEGDLIELYGERVEEIGKRKADWKFAVDVLLLFRPGIVKKMDGYQPVNNYGMYKSYFKIGWRNLVKNKGYSMINIGGLALGMAVAIMIGLWVYDELSFNKYHDNYEDIAEVYRSEVWGGEREANIAHVTGLGTLLKTEYAAHFKNVAMIRGRTEERVLAFGDNRFTQSGYFMQPEGVDILTLKMIQGTGQLKDMNSVLISESVAKKLFGDTDPINQIVQMDAKWDLLVKGVYEDLPKNSSFNDASYFAPLDLYIDGWGSLDSWENYFVYIYVQIYPEGDFAEISKVIKDVMLPHVDDERKETKPEVFLHPMSKWHLDSDYKNGEFVTSKRMMSVWYYSATGIFVLLLACINFMNLSTARSEKRAKEVGIRKSIGSRRSQLIQQFLGETLVVAFLAAVIAMLIVQLSLPWFNSVSDKAISLPLASIEFWMACICFTVFTGLLAGSYPALFLSSLKPIKILKGTFKGGRFSALPRRSLVVLQFTVSISLIIGTIIVYQQIQHAKNRPIGYSREGLISIRAASPEFTGKYNAIRNELKSTGVVEEIAEANYSITDTRGWNGGFAWRDQKFDPSFNTIFVTHEYGKTIGWEFIEGRDFSRDFPTDLSGIVINESALKVMGLENPVGESLTWTTNGVLRGTYQILGVVKDMVKGSPYEPTDPSIIFLSEGDMPWMYIKMNPTASAHEALPKIQAVMNSIAPSAPFDYTFADEAYDAKFRSEVRIGKLATIFSALALLISCLGLFGLAAFIAEQRTKEIGIRKVMGASVLSLWQMLSKDFVILVIISCGLAIPISIYFMNKWLGQYEYRTMISWSIFVATGVGALLITLFTISFQALKAALMNPVKSLRSE
ncbi:ABC transporter permease [Algoriphagus sp. D3-2-R+10]|uniref:ABC transporter permease n=1 Tax=Algoriphagus aurantiacus TaxID=3103948 RepID=UPI002B3C9AD8|nr:ABC transporter permease [Algoriphagus sp. D3-2-R+10]MEB2778181.1 ABC transporter permease [Algoriphagus sp. D3-2-R+10]